MSRLLYSCLMVLLQPLLRLKLSQRGRQEPGYRVAVSERFGFYTTPAWTHDTPTLWVHAVSLGETRAAAVLLRELRQRWPGYRLLLTHGTATGRAEGLALLREGDVQVWQPWDTPAAVRRFLQHFQPRLGILMETEVWPNLSAACAHAGVPLVLANARMNARSLRRAQRLASLSRPAYASLRAVFAQSEDDAVNLRLLGAPVTGVFGNIKFDAQPNPRQWNQGRQWRAAQKRPVLMLASSREGEEDDLLALLDNWPAAREVQWLIVPRHPQRFDAVARSVQAHGLQVSCRSQWQGEPQAVDVWVGDSLGEMALYYGLSDAALLGGSFAPLGGQNLIEAAACGCPVFMGPHTFNFKEAAALALEAGAARRSENLKTAISQALALVQDAPQRETLAQLASQFALSHRGATARTVDALSALLGQQVVYALQVGGGQ